MFDVVADAGGVNGFGHMWGDGWGMGWGGGWMLLVWLAFVGLIVWGVVTLTRRRRDEPPLHDTPRQLLDRRFAAGEISEDEYGRARRALDDGGVLGR